LEMPRRGIRALDHIENRRDFASLAA